MISFVLIANIIFVDQRFRTDIIIVNETAVKNAIESAEGFVYLHYAGVRYCTITCAQMNEGSGIVTVIQNAGKAQFGVRQIGKEMMA